MTLLGTYKLTANTQSFSEDRHMHESVLQEGVVGATDYKVTPGGASLQWSVAAGVAWVLGDTSARQGLYPQVNDAAVTGLVAAGHATLPRIDQVILRVFDSSVTGASNTPTLSTLAGTATAGATLDNRTGAAALPATAMRLADILVPAAQTGVISAANIRDRRPWARGAFRRISRTQNAAAGNDYSTTSATPAAIDATNLSPRIECTGAPVKVTLTGSFIHGLASGRGGLRFAVDGAAVTTDFFVLGHPSAATDLGFLAVASFTPAAGSHVIAPYFWTVNAPSVFQPRAQASLPLVYTIEELVRQDAENT